MDVFRTYRASWLPKDVVAGLILTALLVPQGMAYAELAGLPAITGLYTSILCLLGYAVFGPSKILVLGPDSALGPMIAVTIAPMMLANGDPARAVMLASMLALIVGAVMILAAVARLGFIADLLSKPTRIGYMNGLALTILVGQLPKLFGFSVDANGLIGETKAFVQGVIDGDTVIAALAVGAMSLIVILVLQRWMPKLPAVLIAVVTAIVAVTAFDLVARGVSVVGTLPQGFPPFDIPRVSVGEIVKLIPGALGIALVALVDTISTSSAFAARSGQRVSREPGDDRDRRRQRRGRVVPGLPRQHERLPHGGRRAGRHEDADGGRGGAAAITLILLFVPGLLKNLPQPDAGRGRDRRVVLARGRARHDGPVPAPPHRVHVCRSRPSSRWRSSECCRASGSPSRCRS